MFESLKKIAALPGYVQVWRDMERARRVERHWVPYQVQRLAMKKSETGRFNTVKIKRVCSLFVSRSARAAEVFCDHEAFK